jgi:hypothetical protein
VLKLTALNRSVYNNSARFFQQEHTLSVALRAGSTCQLSVHKLRSPSTPSIHGAISSPMLSR